MSFVSSTYLFFLAGVFLLYFLVPKKIQWVFLLICSYGFYLYGGVKPLFFILLTTATTFGAGLWMGKYEREYKEYLAEHRDEMDRSERRALKAEHNKPKKRILVGVLLLNFGILLLLKYYNTLAEDFNALFSLFKYDLDMPLVNLILPLGISFYIFQSLSYCIDIYRAKYEPERNFFKYALFVSFFPQMVQGPISRFDQLAPQLMAEHSFDLEQFRRGLLLMGWGFFKKLVIADRAAIVVNTVFQDYTEFNGFQTAVAIFVYAMQIYTDFSGGIDITRGVAQCMGIDLVENFQRPYFGTSVSDYWSRWHMSLTGWMRDYVFMPMNMSKTMFNLGKWSRAHISGMIGKQLPSYIVTFTVFFLIGIWHGASPGHLAFAFYNASVIVIGMMLKPALDGLAEGLHVSEENFAFKVFCIIRTFIILVIGKVMVKAVSIPAAFYMLRNCLFNFFHFDHFRSLMNAMGMGGKDWLVLFLALTVLFFVSLFQERNSIQGKDIQVRDVIESKPLLLRWAFYLFVIVVILIFGIYGPGYNATEFIYRAY
ncbi:MAG: MBOAT family protein [Eubacterium sp.]|nr:MBOAT family protein [Eubacterium sp.]